MTGATATTIVVGHLAVTIHHIDHMTGNIRDSSRDGEFFHHILSVSLSGWIFLPWLSQVAVPFAVLVFWHVRLLLVGPRVELGEFNFVAMRLEQRLCANFQHALRLTTLRIQTHQPHRSSPRHEEKDPLILPLVPLFGCNASLLGFQLPLQHYVIHGMLISNVCLKRNSMTPLPLHRHALWPVIAANAHALSFLQCAAVQQGVRAEQAVLPDREPRATGRNVIEHGARADKLSDFRIVHQRTFFHVWAGACAGSHQRRQAFVGILAPRPLFGSDARLCCGAMPLELIPCLIGLFSITANTHRPEVVYVICPASGHWIGMINLPSIRLTVSTVIVTCQSPAATAAFSTSLPENRAQFSLGVHISSFLLLDYVNRKGAVEHGELNSFRRRFGFAPLFLAPT